MDTLQEYLSKCVASGAIDHQVRATMDEQFNVSFYIHAEGKDSPTLDFAVVDNTLLPLQHNKVDSANKTAAQAVAEAGSARTHNSDYAAAHRVLVEYLEVVTLDESSIVDFGAWVTLRLNG